MTTQRDDDDAARDPLGELQNFINDNDLDAAREKIAALDRESVDAFLLLALMMIASLSEAIKARSALAAAPT